MASLIHKGDLLLDFLKVRAVLRLQCFMIDVVIKYKIKEYRNQMKAEKKKQKFKQ